MSRGKPTIVSDDETLVIVESGERPAHGLDMMTWLHTEGGRKCPLCGKYARPSELGWVGARGRGIVVDAYGHLPGFGCNRGDAGPTRGGAEAGGGEG